MKLTVFLLSLAGLLQAAAFLKIASFNIRTFGEKKISNVTIADIIVKILNRYDIALIQEVRDSHLTAVGKLMDKLNRDSPDAYHFIVSEPLGRNSYKERYLFVFRPEKVSLLDSYQYDDGCECYGNDTFSREPSVVMFSSPSTEVKQFIIVSLHAAPAEAVKEIDALYDVYLDVISKWNMDSILFMGDFNAGCSYVSASSWSTIRLRTDPEFQWLISDDVDTTVTSTHCPYDRIVASGKELKRSIWPESATTFNFEKAYKLNQGMALAVSDHYPVEVTLKSV
ncbi:deoxyribonuclease-1 [Tachyglossus aculeatus]|uniref:deoxyribonuclease-1 n=1 Tax=Tachyglossus aculeatus TaxID=9261 RepID=UPI0018F6B9C7|nr:deoxyribonuclease-1 [Tachyglossus aculeatus]